MAKPSAWIRALPARYGKSTLIALGVIVAIGLLARAYVVVNPAENPADDSRAYFALAKSLYTEGSYGGPEFRDASDWSPGAPLLYAAAFYVTGGAREGTARSVEALMGVAAILVVFALGRRLALAAGGRGGGPARGGIDPPAAVGLLAALAVAVYPPFIHSTGELMSEPPAILTLPAAILAFFWAADLGTAAARGSSRGEEGRPGEVGPPGSTPPRSLRWLLAGLLFGATAMFRPEYLLIGIAFVGLAAAREGLRRGRRPGIAAGALVLAGIVVVVLPWTVRNAIVLDKLVPLSTGGGKALYVGTYLPADGEYQRVKATLYEEQTGISLDPHSRELDEVSPTPLFDEVAVEAYPDLGREQALEVRDEALGKVGRENFSTYFGEDPLGYLGMTVRKVGRMWSSGVGEAMSSTIGRIAQITLVALGLAGFALLGTRRRWWELTALATPIVLVTLVGAASLAAPRRNEVLMTLVFPLAALTLCRLAAAISSARGWSRVQASSPPS